MFQYLNSDKKSMIYEKRRYIHKRISKKGLVTWICSQCLYVTLKTLNDCVTSIPVKHHSKKCREFCEIEVECEIAYNNLKDKSIQADFKFAKEYEAQLLMLQSKYDTDIVAEYWPALKTARSTTGTLRTRAKTTPITANTQSSIIDVQ